MLPICPYFAGWFTFGTFDTHMTAQRSILGLLSWFLLHWILLINSKRMPTSFGILDRWSLDDGRKCYQSAHILLAGSHLELLTLTWPPRGQFLDFCHGSCCIGFSLSIARECPPVLEFWTGDHWMTVENATNLPIFCWLVHIWNFWHSHDRPEVNSWTFVMVLVALDSPYQ